MNNELVQVKIRNSSLNEIRVFFYDVFKRLFDIIISLFGIILLIPIIIAVKIANIINHDYNNLFFIQKRIGLNGELFKLYKFRSMKVNADEDLKELLKDKKIYNEYKINKKLENDPRITKVGKFIRKNSIDELPQLINVLKGDMSLIGNRPYLPREKEDMTNFYEEIIKTKPGITGLWQTSGRNKTNFRKRLELESYYSNNRCLKLDVKIFFKTFKEVFINKFTK